MVRQFLRTGADLRLMVVAIVTAFFVANAHTQTIPLAIKTIEDRVRGEAVLILIQDADCRSFAILVMPDSVGDLMVARVASPIAVVAIISAMGRIVMTVTIAIGFAAWRRRLREVNVRHSALRQRLLALRHWLRQRQRYRKAEHKEHENELETSHDFLPVLNTLR
jgi:hypothetical protein